MKKAQLVLESPAGTISLPTDEWANVIVLAEDAGWSPQRPRLSYLVPGTAVSETDAHLFSSALQKIVDAALANPLAVYPVRARMEFVCLCAELGTYGGFTIGTPRPA